MLTKYEIEEKEDVIELKVNHYKNLRITPGIMERTLSWQEFNTPVTQQIDYLDYWITQPTINYNGITGEYVVQPNTEYSL